MSDVIAVTGYSEMMRAINRMEKTTKKKAKSLLKEVGRMVATEAQSIARQKGLVRTGNLVRSIKPSVTVSTARIVESALSYSGGQTKGFPYPKIYEYGGATHRASRKGSSAVSRRSQTAGRLGLGAGATRYTGSRAFMAPALAAKKEEGVRKFEEILSELEREWGKA